LKSLESGRKGFKFMTNYSLARLAAMACLAGGVLFFTDFTLVGWAAKTHFLSHSIPAVNSVRAVLWVVTALGLTGGALGLALSGATGEGWRKKLAFCGVIWSLLGAVSYVAGTIFIYNFPDRPTKQFFTPLGSLLLTIGMLKLAAAVLTAGVWRDWRRFVPLQLPLQIVFFLGQGAGPNPLLLGIWGLFWALLGAVIWTSIPKSESVEIALEKI
jgi:hypothetical protein